MANTETVSALSLLCISISLLITFVMPIVLVIVLCIKRKIHILPVLIGAAVFTVFQLIIRIPALTIARQMSPEFGAFTQTPLWGGLFLGLTAGIFEEFGRFIGYKVALKKRTGWNDGFAFGLGHGGIEAVTLTGLAFVNNAVYALMINTGNWGLIEQALPADQAKQLFDGMVNTPSYMFLVGGMERIFAMTIQVALSILVLYAIRRRKFIYVLFAVLLHLVVDSPIIFLMQQTGVWGTEAYAMLCAVAAAIYIVRSRKVFARMDAQVQPINPAEPV
ncbi:YhfC family intramembrane metalloprotease [Acetanaerobacterium elongatum]|uniref:Uncharacterized membrane protein YhfC n=1 Tax=Acetanaerobacterium elongatum TaxID=258515 RepID=A0A1H0C222_9FIRM|nr:YhfC family glutamic-type intramembrane protease [Acetanaerobacterium elongatum]SDN51948.1 Uncharacterized membrane protein YhfC [Acetanaerobacterium elongatum]